MHDEQSFRQAMQENPEDTSLRLVFADWLEEQGDQRAELIRLLHTLTQSVEVPDRSNLEKRLRSLMSAGVEPVGPFFANSMGMKLAWIPAGTFMMGSPKSEKGRGEDETQHQVTLSRGFYLAVYPVTQVTWQEVMGKNPSEVLGDDLPMVKYGELGWEDCQEFFQKLSERDGHLYRLPTEAEWEYACRAGTTTPFSFGQTISGDQASYGKECGQGKFTSVGSFLANAFGLYDMHGNVWEWCEDWYGEYPQEAVVDPHGPASPPSQEDGRVCRGGSFWFDETGLSTRSANRFWEHDVGFDVYVGFRPALTPGPTNRGLLDDPT